MVNVLQFHNWKQKKKTKED